MQALERLCGDEGAKLLLGSPDFGPRWGSRVDLFQPRTAALQLLHQSIKGRYVAELAYIEIALDMIAKDQAKADAIGAGVLRHCVRPYQRRDVCLRGSIFYWASRLAPSNLVLYLDKPSKQAGARDGSPCAHLEVRLRGSPALAQANLYGLPDVIGLDHLAFWERAVRLYSIRSYAELGRWLGTAASGSALRKRAHAYLGDFAVNGTFILQNALLADRDVMQVLRPIEVANLFVGRRGRLEPWV